MSSYVGEGHDPVAGTITGWRQGFLQNPGDVPLVSVPLNPDASSYNYDSVTKIATPVIPTVSQIVQSLRTNAKNLLTDSCPSSKLLRATLLHAIDQHNSLLTWLGTQAALTNKQQLANFTLSASGVQAKIISGAAD